MKTTKLFKFRFKNVFILFGKLQLIFALKAVISIKPVKLTLTYQICISYLQINMQVTSEDNYLETVSLFPRK